MSQGRNYNRRTALSLMGAAPLMAGVAKAATSDKLDFWVGTYSRDGQKGLYPLSLDLKTDSFKLGVADTQIEGVSFGAFSPKHGLYYLLNEKDGTAGVYAKGKTGLKKLTQISSLGAGPCYAALDKTQTFLAMANYGGGNISLYKLDGKAGLPVGEGQQSLNAGHGPNASRQTGPHAHWVQFAPDSSRIYSVDLGTDEILAYGFDAKAGVLGPRTTAFKTAPGAGPRHMVFHPTAPMAFLLCELDNSLLSLTVAVTGELSQIDKQPTLPGDFTGKSQAGHIAINAAGTRVYVSNRGHNSLVVFAVAADGRLTKLQTVASGGNWPRFFMLDDARQRLIACHQNSGDIVLFTVAADGTLIPTQTRTNVAAGVFMIGA